MEEAISAIRRTGAEMGLPYLMGLYAEALGDSGRLDGARKSVEADLELGRCNGTYFQLAEVLRIEAFIRENSGGGPDEIEQMLHKAANVATLQRSAIGQLRIAVELARGLRRRGEVDEARELIAPHGELVGKLGDSQDGRAASEFC
ncbi:hypothetical protein NKI04_34380 [Mesorhizobium sp. M0814]|uniref:hypothetical protein n=1 Tax=Mesorhizobium sp. M0814 TaxID=2957004 RepID=UPI00333812D7